MVTISIAVEEERLLQFLAVIRSLRYAEVLAPLPQNAALVAPTRSFSDLVGKLTWQGDALAEQQRLRDEW